VRQISKPPTIERQKATRKAEQNLTIAGQRHRTGIAVEYGDADLFFKFLDLHRYGRRCAENRIGGGRETARVCNRDESAKDIDIEHWQRMLDGRCHNGTPVMINQIF
jgi:hypothetical protein